MKIKECPNCGKKLDINDKASCKCRSCGHYLNKPSNQSSQSNQKSDTKSSNTISAVLGACGIIIIIVGIICSIIISYLGFIYLLLALFVSVVTGLFFLGMAEIIQLLDDIKHK